MRNQSVHTGRWAITGKTQEGALRAAQKNFPGALIVSVSARGVWWNRIHVVTLEAAAGTQATTPASATALVPAARPAVSEVAADLEELASAQVKPDSWVFTESGRGQLQDLEARLEGTGPAGFGAVLEAAERQELPGYHEDDLIPKPVLPSLPAPEPQASATPLVEEESVELEDTLAASLLQDDEPAVPRPAPQGGILL